MCPPKKVKLLSSTLISTFFSATSYLIRSHPACWVTSSENSAAISLTITQHSWMWLLPQEGCIIGSVFVGEKNYIGISFPQQLP